MSDTQAHARLGDATTNGGEIVQASANLIIGGRPAAREGDAAWCPDCRTFGALVSSNPTFIGNDRPLIRDGDAVFCRCLSKPRVCAGQRHTLSGVHIGAGVAIGQPADACVDTSGTQKDTPYRVRFRIIDAQTQRPLIHRPYILRRTDGTTVRGVTDDQGFSDICESRDADHAACHALFAAPRCTIDRSNGQ